MIDTSKFDPGNLRFAGDPEPQPITQAPDPTQNTEPVVTTDPVDGTVPPNTEGTVDNPDSTQTTAEVYAIDSEGNLTLEREGKSYVVAGKDAYSFNEETGEVSINDDIDTDNVVFNTDFREAITPLLELLPVERRNLRFDGTVPSMVEILKTVGEAQVLATIDELSANQPEASDLILHLLEGGNVKDFLNRSTGTKIDLAAITDKPTADQIKQVVTAFLTDVVKLTDVDGFYESLKTTEQLGNYFNTAKEGLANHYSVQEAAQAQALRDREAKETEKIQKYWNGIEQKVNTLDLGGLTIPNKETADKFFKFIAIPVNGTETEEQQFAKNASDEIKLAERFVRFNLKNGTIKLADLNRLFTKATTDPTKRLVKAVISKKTTSHPSSTAGTGGAGTSTPADLTKLKF